MDGSWMIVLFDRNGGLNLYILIQLFWFTVVFVISTSRFSDSKQKITAIIGHVAMYIVAHQSMLMLKNTVSQNGLAYMYGELQLQPKTTTKQVDNVLNSHKLSPALVLSCFIHIQDLFHWNRAPQILHTVAQQWEHDFVCNCFCNFWINMQRYRIELVGCASALSITIL